MTEAVRDLARDGGERLARDELAIGEVLEGTVDVQLGVEVGDRPAPEHPPHERAVTEHRPRIRGQRVDARRDQRLQRVRDADGRALTLFDEHPDRLLDEQRVALRLVEEHGPQPVGQRRTFDECVDELRDLGLWKRPELDRNRSSSPSAPTRPRVEKLGTCETHDQDRGIVDAIGQMLDEVEERLLRPVDVLEPEHERLCLSEVRRPLVRSPRDLLAATTSRDVVQHTGCEPEEIGDGVARARVA